MDWMKSSCHYSIVSMHGKKFRRKQLEMVGKMTSTCFNLRRNHPLSRLENIKMKKKMEI